VFRLIAPGFADADVTVYFRFDGLPLCVGPFFYCWY